MKNKTKINKSLITSELFNYILFGANHSEFKVGCALNQKCPNPGYLFIYFFVISVSQVQQMADGFAADIDKQLASKTKELLG